MPGPSAAIREQIIDAGASRSACYAPERSLADHYNPLAMDLVLVQAHENFDRVVKNAFGTKGVVSTEAGQVLLFRRYADLTGE